MANGSNLIFSINTRKKRIEIQAKTNALTKPTTKNGMTSAVITSHLLIKETALAPNIIGTAIIKVKSAAARCLSPINTPPEMVAPDLENPGHSAIHWNKPIKIACLYVTSSSEAPSDSLFCFAFQSAIIINTAPATKASSTVSTLNKYWSIISSNANPSTAAGKSPTITCDNFKRGPDVTLVSLPPICIPTKLHNFFQKTMTTANIEPS